MQLYAERYPHFIHHLIDIVNAHTSISRHAVLTALLENIHDADASLADVDALTYYLLFYHSPGPTLVQVLSSFILHLQTDGLDQGCGIAGYGFNLTFSRAIAVVLRSIQPSPPHPPLPLPILVHDDTTIPLPPITSPSATTPFYLILLTALESHLLLHLRLTIAVHKNIHFQMPIPSTSPFHISHSTPHFDPKATVTSSHYRLAGGPVGTPAGRRAFLASLTSSTYGPRLTHFISIPGIHAHGAILIITLCLRPQTTFNHHFRLTPPSITTQPSTDAPSPTPLSTESNTTAVRAVASVLRLDPDILLTNTPTLTAFQLLQPASSGGGISLPDATTVAPSAFTSSFIDSLPALTLDPLLQPLLADPTSWATSPCPTLVEFFSTFTSIVNTPTLATPPAYDVELHETVHSLLFDPSTGRPSISNIRLLSGRHCQSVFSHAVSRHTFAIRITAHAAPHAIARLRACALRGAASLLLCHSIPQGALLTNAQFIFFICHRLGIPLASPNPHSLISPTAALRCTRKCRTITTTKPLTNTHPLFPLRQHCLHQLTCGCSKLRLRRHNQLARLVANHLSAEGGLEASLTASLHSSLTSQTKVDLVLTSAIAELATAIDFTVSCPLLPSYLAAAITDASAIITTRADEKISKHAAGSAARNRLFLPWVITTFGGMGPHSIWHWIDSIFASSASLARLSESSTHAIARRKAAFLACLQATLTRSCYDMLITHTSPPPTAAAPPPPSHPPQPPVTSDLPANPDAAATAASTDALGPHDVESAPSSRTSSRSSTPDRTSRS